MTKLIFPAGSVVETTTGKVTVTIPGGSGSGPAIWTPDSLPASPNAGDHEFDVALADGFAIGSPDIINTSDLPSHLRIQKTTPGAWNMQGRGWTLSALGISVPFTVTAKLADSMTGQPYRWAGCALAEATPGAMFTRGFGSSSGYGNATANIGRGRWSSPSSRSGWDGDDVRSMTLPFYTRWVVTASNDIAWYASANGLVWTLYDVNFDPGFTVGSVLLMTGSNDNNQTVEAAFDWMRFKQGTSGQTWNGMEWV